MLHRFSKIASFLFVIAFRLAKWIRPMSRKGLCSHFVWLFALPLGACGDTTDNDPVDTSSSSADSNGAVPDGSGPTENICSFIYNSAEWTYRCPDSVECSLASAFTVCTPVNSARGVAGIGQACVKDNEFEMGDDCAPSSQWLGYGSMPGSGAIKGTICVLRARSTSQRVCSHGCANGADCQDLGDWGCDIFAGFCREN